MKDETGVWILGIILTAGAEIAIGILNIWLFILILVLGGMGIVVGLDQIKTNRLNKK